MRASRVPSVAELLRAYRIGVFPMGYEGALGEHLDWYHPDPRAIIPLDAFHVPRSLRRRLRARPFRITTDTAFEQVIVGCAAPRPDEPRTWITPAIRHAFIALHHAGHAHSIEAWADSPAGGTLVGGLYGVHLGAAFFAESMFCRPDLGGTDASKACLVHLLAHLSRREFDIFDTQIWSPHLARFGCVEIPRAEFLQRLAVARERPIPWTPIDPGALG